MARGAATPPLKYCDGGVWSVFVGAKGNDVVLRGLIEQSLVSWGKAVDTWRKAVNIVHCS